MGWGYRGWGAPPGKKATAASLSISTLERIVAQQKAEEAAQARYFVMAAQRRQEEEARAVEERRLEALHGGRDALVKWRADNAERLAVEAQAKREADRKAAGEKAIVDELAELRSELSQLPSVANLCSAAGATSFQINKSQVKAAFHLTDRELESLPKEVIQKEGAKRASKILWASSDIFNAVARKEGKKRLRQYQAAYSPTLARRFVEDELLILENKHPSLVERGRAKAVETLRAADDAAIASAKSAEQQVEAAMRALEAAHEKQRNVRAALRRVATADEIDGMNLAELPEEDDEDEDDGYRSNHKRGSASRTPFTVAAAGAAKKQRLGAGPSSAGADVD